MLPNGSLPLHGWRIVTFVDDDGDVGIQILVDGEPTVVDTFGALNYALHCMTAPRIVASVIDGSINYPHDDGE